MHIPLVHADLASAEQRQRIAPLWSWPLIALVLVAVAYASVLLSGPDASVSLWWPAAGLGVCFALRAERRRLPAALAVIGLCTLVAELAGGRGAPLAVPYGLISAVEVAVVILVLRPGAQGFRLRTTRDASRLVVAALTAALITGALISTTTLLLKGTEFGQTLVNTFAAHLAALLLITPLAALPPGSLDRLPRVESLAQATVLVASIPLAFLPGSFLPLATLPFAFIVWGAARLPAALALGEALFLASASLLLTAILGPPSYISILDAREMALVIEAYMITIAVFTIMLVTTRYEARAAMATATSASQLLSGGLVDSQVGLVIAQQEADGIIIVWANRSAFHMLNDELSEDRTWSGPLARNAVASMTEHVQTVYEKPEGGVISVLAHPIPDQGGRFSTQLVDVTASVRMTRAREAAEQARAAARTALAELERQRDDLIATTSHELRTPITSIAGYTELLQESDRLSAQERSWVEIVGRNTERLSELVEDLLTLGNASDASASDIRAVTLTELATRSVEAHRSAAEAKGLSLRVETDPALIVHGPAADLRRAVGNLVANAVTFTPPGGTVRIWSDTEDGRIALRITDTGPGMSPATLAHAFDRFYRGAEAAIANAPGTGLGLPIAERLMARNEGAILLESLPGGGLTASVVFRDPTPAE
ncbi:ATP-binding protein [Microbacterium sp. SORGH_AS_0888]|uniref:ATP-binding protein n=1 Tax=Microbacterium sp. SORGH_AS_0888 TaxID=3041791 RepID=UPI00277FF755|nr:ATP-binding protein [Microbacterium sp. SORGH_AS_0888]MDQ1130411.1 two-component system phosphate regulon sensor histidine kinase PhoR [Microbacterium sp. SORGH_AS_0888]